MAFGSDIAKLLASLDLDTRPFEKGARRVDGSLDRMEGGMGRVSTRAIAFGSALGVGIERLAEKGIDVLFDSLRTGEEQLHILQDTTAQTEAVIASTGGAAGQTSASVRQLAEELENLTTADDKAIQQGENLLLTFTNIGGDVFPDATKAMVNMAIAMNKGNAETADFDSAAIQLGKALNDPIKGITALQRVGVSFTEDQAKRIKNLVKEGKLEEAQGVILAELTKEFGKAGEAAGKAESAGLRRFHDAIQDTQIALARGLSPALDAIRGEITTALANPQTQRDIENLGRFLGEAAKSGLAFAKSIPWGQVADGLKTAAGFAGKLIDTFAHLPPGVQGTIIALAGLNKLTGGGVIRIGVDLFKEGAKGILGQFFQRGGSPAAPMFTKEVGLGGRGATVPVGGKGGLTTIGKIAVIGEVIGLIAAVNAVKDAVQEGWKNQTNDITDDLTAVIERGRLPEIQQALAGIDQGLADLGASDPTKKIPWDAVTGPVIDALRADRQRVIDALDAIINRNTPGSPDDRSDKLADIAKSTQGLVDRTERFGNQELANLEKIAQGGFVKWRPSDVIQVEDRRKDDPTRDTAIAEAISPTLGKVAEAVASLAESQSQVQANKRALAAMDRAEKFGRQELRNLEIIAKNTKDDPDQTSKKTKQHFDRTQARIDILRQSTSTKLAAVQAVEERVRDRVESARQAVQTGTQRVADRTLTATDVLRNILGAIQRLDLTANVNVNVSGTSPYQSSGGYGGGGGGRKAG